MKSVVVLSCQEEEEDLVVRGVLGRDASSLTSFSLSR